MKDLLYELYVQAGRPSLDDITAAVLADDDLSGAPGRDSINRILGSTQLPPSQADVVAVATVLARLARWEVTDAVHRARDGWVKAHLAAARPPTGPGQPVAQANPLALEVHPAITAGSAADGLDVLPVYIPRAHDSRLATVVEEVRNGACRLVMLVGGSSTGKTRACWEAVRSLGEPWRLWHPIDPSRPTAALGDLPQLGPYTVVWLNEAQHYLLTSDPALGEQIAAGLRELLRGPGRGPVLVLGTLWPQYWDILTAVPAPGVPDPHAQTRELIKDCCIRLPETFAGADLQAAGEYAARSGDPRLTEALRQASSGHLTQYLAGGPALIARYDNAEPAARAVLDAAIDARRLGHGPALTRLFLEEAAAGYLTDEQWDLLSDDWLERAFAYLADPRPCRGARPPLTRIRPRPGSPSVSAGTGGEPCYRLADYLEQYGARQRRLLFPPAAFWNAAVRHAATLSDHVALAKAAQERGRHRHAFALWQHAADVGDASALYNLTVLRERTGDYKAAEHLARAAAAAGDTTVLYRLAERRQWIGDHESAERLAYAAADAGDASVLCNMARLRERAADHEGAERLARAAAKAGDASALHDLAWLREQRGDDTGAERLARAAVEAGNTSALQNLARLRERAGDTHEAERLAREAAEAGHTYALHDLVERRQRLGEHEGAERLQNLITCTEAASDSSVATRHKRATQRSTGEQLTRETSTADRTYALRRRAERYEQTGNLLKAEELYRLLAKMGDPSALQNLARMRERAGDLREAEELYRTAVGMGDPSALQGLAWMRERAGDLREAEHLAQAAAAAGDTTALRHLAERREWAGDLREAEHLAQAAAAAGDTTALRHMAERRERIGDAEGAERLAQAAAAAGDPSALQDLSGIREQAGDHQDAERLAYAAADAGNTSAFHNLIEQREQAGDRQGAERLAYAAADAGDASALWNLARLRMQTIADERWKDLLRFGLEADGTISDPW
ncbi:hypothetical protein ACFOWE_31830 [Planomonospora corallina]|uniref:Tetratricopeptide repeat protein n=1 Tax=Planomonospora corallina TaxID=1806052 RepID=A0ABV8IIW2_9ACTN